jgi:hypothetical protein
MHVSHSLPAVLVRHSTCVLSHGSEVESRAPLNRVRGYIIVLSDAQLDITRRHDAWWVHDIARSQRQTDT